MLCKSRQKRLRSYSGDRLSEKRYTCKKQEDNRMQAPWHMVKMPATPGMRKGRKCVQGSLLGNLTFLKLTVLKSILIFLIF
jgi:hypothetical protein